MLEDIIDEILFSNSKINLDNYTDLQKLILIRLVLTYQGIDPSI